MTNSSVNIEIKNYEQLKLNSECMNVEKTISVDEITSASSNIMPELPINLKAINPDEKDELTQVESNLVSTSNMTYKNVSFNKNISCSLSLGELIKRVKSEPPVKMIYSPIKDKSFGILYGLPKTGKTLFCESLAMCMAAGRTEFLGKSIDLENRKVLFVSLEESYQGRTLRNITQLSGFNEEEIQSIVENYIVVNEHAPRIIQSKDDWDILVQQVKEHKPGVVFLDSMTRLVNDIENLESAKPALLRFRALAEDYNTAVIVIHHSVKVDQAKPLTLQSIAGSRIVSQEADYVMGINKTIDNRRYLKLLFARYVNDDIDKVDVFKLNENLGMDLMGQEYENNLLLNKSDGRVDDSNPALIFDYFKSKPLNSELTTKELVETLVGPKKMSEPTLHKGIDKLIASGKIIKVSHGIYKIA